MARRLMSPFYRADGTDSAVLNGAKIHFYLTGTTTPTDTYQASSGGSAHANPVVADSAGLFAPIYINDAILTRAVLKNSAGSTNVSDTSGPPQQMNRARTWANRQPASSGETGS